MTTRGNLVEADDKSVAFPEIRRESVRLGEGREVAAVDLRLSPAEVRSVLPDSTSSSLRREVAGAHRVRPTHSRGRLSALEERLEVLTELIANVTESYSAVIFITDHRQGVLRVGGVHTLSREFLADVEIPIGCGLVGWTAENKVRISVCPFEHDSTTLLYYSSDQSLKSFVAVPILGSDDGSREHGRLLGVIACDSKKSYAFAKITEKILHDCALQAASLIELSERISRMKEANDPRRDLLVETIEKLRGMDDEKSLLNAAANLPASLVDRDALVVLALAEGGVGTGTFFGGGNFYAGSGQSTVSHRLFELVCKHKKLICAERSVHALPTDDIKQRSFLSVPFSTFGKEAGSFNLLSKPHAAFGDSQISSLERIASVVGRELERIRLRDRFISSVETTGIQSWKHFSLQAKGLLKDANQSRQLLALVRFSFDSLLEIEDLLGVSAATLVMQRVMRLVDQVFRSPCISCYLHGSHIVSLVNAHEVERMMVRLKNLIERLTAQDLHVNNNQLQVGKLLVSGMRVVHAVAPRDGESIEQLAAKTVALLELGNRSGPVSKALPTREHRKVDSSEEAIANVGNWS